MLLPVQRELRSGETEWLWAEPTMSLVIAHVRGGAEYGLSLSTHVCTRPNIHVECSWFLFRSVAGFRPGRCTWAQAPSCHDQIWLREVGLTHPLSLGLCPVSGASCTTRDHGTWGYFLFVLWQTAHSLEDFRGLWNLFGGREGENSALQ